MPSSISPVATAPLAAVLALGLLAGCGSEERQDPVGSIDSVGASESVSPTPQPTTATGSAAPTVDVPEVLRFSGTTVDGAAFDGATLAGRPTVFWFWAPWCPVCRGQISEVQDLAATYGDRVNVIGIGSLDSGGAIEDFAADAAGPTHLTDPDGKLWKRFRVAEQSSFVVLDSDGREVLRSGYRDKADVERAVEKALG